MACDNNNPEWNPYDENPPRMMGDCFNPNLSIFIPSVFKNSNTINFIKKTFYDNNLGLVYHIDLIKNKNNKYCAFVYIRWYTNKYTLKIQNELVGNNSKYIFNYTENSYWIFLKNNNPKTREELINHQENILQKKIIKINNDFLKQIEHYSKIAEQNINAINCENRSIFISEFCLYWDNDKLQYVPSINLIKNNL